MKRWLVLLVIVLVIPWIIWTNRTIGVSHFEINNKKLPVDFDDFKIAQVSDLHNHDWEGKLLEKIQEEKPDLITITGDLVDSSNTDFDLALDFVEAALDIAPIYYISGNHEAWLGADYSILKERLEKAGVEVMDNASSWIEKGKSRIHIIGLQDPDFTEGMMESYTQEENLGNKTSELLAKESFNLLLSHRPEQFKEYVKAKADLVLTGHAHGGQVRIPFVGGLVAPNQGFFPEYSEGLYREEGTHMIVSRGLGNSIIPVRINNQPELVIIEFKAE